MPHHGPDVGPFAFEAHDPERQAKLPPKTYRGKSAQEKCALWVRSAYRESEGADVTDVHISPLVEISIDDGWLELFVAGRAVRIGPLSVEQLEKIGEEAEVEAARLANEQSRKPGPKRKRKAVAEVQASP